MFLYRDVATGELVAVKRCRVKESDDPGDGRGERMVICTIREVSSLMALKDSGGHENIIGWGVVGGVGGVGVGVGVVWVWVGWGGGGEGGGSAAVVWAGAWVWG